MSGKGERRLSVTKVADSETRVEEDRLAVEEPLEIRVGRAGDRQAPQSLSVTMRTPGNDFELAVGFLFTEGILRGRGDLRSVEYARHGVRGSAENVVEVILEKDATFDPSSARRNFYTTSSCGVCGKASLESLRIAGVAAPPGGRPRVRSEVVPTLPDRLREAQAIFSTTGGLHAAGRFAADGRLGSIREDIGRHNAVDKLVGEGVLADRVPLHDEILVVSGRAGFEILQKAAVAGFAFVVAVGAPSTLAVDIAREFGMTLIGFARGGRYNVYAGADRLLNPVTVGSSS